MSDAAMEQEKKLADLRRLYIEGIDAKFVEIEQGWRAMSERIDEEQLETIIRKVHSFAGSGGMYGFIAVSETAARFERKLVEIRETGGLPSLEQREEGQSRLEALGRAIRECNLGVDSTD